MAKLHPKRNDLGKSSQFLHSLLHSFAIHGFRRQREIDLLAVTSITYKRGRDGGTGRRSGLKIRRYLVPWGFNSPSRHQLFLLFVDPSTHSSAERLLAYLVKALNLAASLLIAKGRPDLRNCYTSLIPRERQVMALVVAGLLNKQVGRELGISEIPLKAHRGPVMQKMKANFFADLVRIRCQAWPVRQLS